MEGRVSEKSGLKKRVTVVLGNMKLGFQEEKKTKRGGLSSGWSLIRVVSPQGGLSSG